MVLIICVQIGMTIDRAKNQSKGLSIVVVMESVVQVGVMVINELDVSRSE